MFERFTERARRVLVLAQEEARLLEHNFIGTEHILLGLVRESDGVAAQVLVGLGADLSRVRQEVIQLVSGYQVSSRPRDRGVADPEKAVFPRCGRCGASWSGSARYRSMEVRPGAEEKDRAVLSTTVLYCGECGTVIGSPVSPIATALLPPLATVVYLRPAPGGTAEPSRRFPDELLGSVQLEEVTEAARVELSYRDNDEIKGTVAGEPVRMTGELGPRGGPVRGTWGGVAVGWRLGDRFGAPAGRTTGVIRGRVGDDRLNLEGSFLLGPRYVLQEAEISGDLCGHNLRAKVSSAEGGLSATSSVIVEGNVGEEPFQLFASLSDDLARAVVRGSLGGRTVFLDATTEKPSTVRVVGEFAGPLPLLALIVNVLVHFL